MAGNDTLALLPTGGGKSVCYQVPALAMGGLTLVVSPLIALMKDQVRQLRERHIAAACIVSGMSSHEIEAILNNSVFNRINILYVSPERLQNRTFIDHFRQMPIKLIAVDEAHCISQWGYDFRPPYLEIARIRQYHPQCPVIALTATATPEVVDDIKARLAFRNGTVFRTSFVRKNLSYSVRRTDDKASMLLRIVRGVGGSGIVYVRNRRRAVEIAKALADNGIPSATYHAGIEMKERDRIQQQWLKSQRGVMVATTAFGMGIDKPDVRFVVHYDLPESPEAYFQEAGRAGRDGKKAYAVLLYQQDDIERLTESWEQDFPSMKYIKSVYAGICNYYQLPVGAGQDSRFDFALEDICRSYNFDVYPFFRATTFLEREGLIALPEHNDLQSRLYIIIGKEELYRYQVANKRAGEVITATLRLYGGLFTDYTPISEGLIAKRCGLSETQVCNIFTELNRLQIAFYQPKTLKPQIIFTSPRIDFNNLYVSDTNYKELKQSDWRRRKAMIAYVENSHECRSRQLVRYFGEEEEHQCGICDVCLAKKKTGSTMEAEQRIAAALGEGRRNIKELATMLPDISEETLTQAARRMLDKGTIHTDADYCLYIKDAL